MQKIKKHHYGFVSSQNGTEQAESDTKKKKKNIFVPIHSNQTRNKAFQKKIAKKC